MMRLRGAAALCLLAGCAGLWPTAPAFARAERTVSIRTIPPTPGARIVLRRGGTFVTGRDGAARLPAGAIRPAVRERVLRGALSDGIPVAATVKGVRLADGGWARVDRFFGTTIAMGMHYRIRPRFLGPDGREIDPRDIDSYTLRSRHGVVLTVRGTEAVTLKRSRVVRLNRGLESKAIEWSVESVMVDGSNVVRRAQQRFDPGELDGTLPIKLLYFSVRFDVSDALFGSAVRSEIVLTHPDGTVRRHRVRGDGTLRLPALPRGEYQVAVEASGISPQSPLLLSRDQVVEIQVISYLDLAVAVLLLGGLAIGLLVLRRPHLRVVPGAVRRRAVSITAVTREEEAT